MEVRQVGLGAQRHLDAGLVGLLDVAPPQLVEALEQLLLGAPGQRHLEDELRLARRRSPRRSVGARHPSAVRVAATCAAVGSSPSGGTSPRRFAEPSATAALTVAADQRRRATSGPILMPKAPGRLQVLGHRRQPAGQVAARPAGPVDDRALRQVGQEPLDLRHLPQQHQAGARPGCRAASYQPRLCDAPLRLDRRPRRALQEAHRRLAGPCGHEREVLVARDLADGERRHGAGGYPGPAHGPTACSVGEAGRPVSRGSEEARAGRGRRSVVGPGGRPSLRGRMGGAAASPPPHPHRCSKTARAPHPGGVRGSREACGGIRPGGRPAPRSR